jgi:hypothetical protein
MDRALGVAKRQGRIREDAVEAVVGDEAVIEDIAHRPDAGQEAPELAVAWFDGPLGLIVRAVEELSQLRVVVRRRRLRPSENASVCNGRKVQVFAEGRSDPEISQVQTIPAVRRNKKGLTCGSSNMLAQG